jgi:2-polyprenyl-3-methyl-5-hydroxy-6-metoxy-1,4-benzoquinol methylase
MATTSTPAELQPHNDAQRRYFESTLKKTMVPGDTPYLRRQVRELVRQAGVRPGDRILDVGCGMGRYTLLLADMGFRVEGLDLAPALLDRLQEFNGGRYEIPTYAGDLLGHAEGLANRFDAVVGFFALHHFHTLDDTFLAMAQMVRPGGRVVFLEPNPYNPSYYVQILVMPRITWQGERGLLKMRRAPMFSAMTAAGLESPSVVRFGLFPPALANRTWTRPIEALGETLLAWTPCLAFQVFSATRPLNPTRRSVA